MNDSLQTQGVRPMKRFLHAAAWSLPLLGILTPLLFHSPKPRALTALEPRTVIIGGGPDLAHNQVGIESNVRYVDRLLPSGTPRTILFADGNPNRSTVQYAKTSAPPPAPAPRTPGGKAFSLIFEDDDEGQLSYRPPKLSRIDGSTQRQTVSTVFDQIHRQLTQSTRPLFLYFTGHGSQSDGPFPANSEYDLWGDKPLTVQDLAQELKKVPTDVPVSLVMVQCFSGGFGNLLFENGLPNGRPLDRDLAGFFAATPDRMSAGCTPTVDESEYKDFTSYFFAALSGVDRVGRKVTGVDYNHDGRVGMNEAYDYSLLEDESIDVPTCTSDYFLRRFMPANDVDVFKAPYSSVLKWATPGQQVALEGLSQKLNMTGENRMATGYQQMQRIASGQGGTPTGNVEDSGDRFEQIRDSFKEALTRRWPTLKDPKSKGYASARAKALKRLDQMAKAGYLNDLFQTSASSDDEDAIYSLRGSQLLRFIRLGKSVILAHRLASEGNPKLLAQWKRLQQAESRSPLPFTS